MFFVDYKRLFITSLHLWRRIDDDVLSCYEVTSFFSFVHNLILLFPVVSCFVRTE